MKQTKQRVVITITDKDEGIIADITFEPSIRDRKIIEAFPPSACAGIRLMAVIKNIGQDLGKPLSERIHPEAMAEAEEKRIIVP